MSRNEEAPDKYRMKLYKLLEMCILYVLITSERSFNRGMTCAVLFHIFMQLGLLQDDRNLQQFAIKLSS